VNYDGTGADGVPPTSGGGGGGGAHTLLSGCQWYWPPVASCYDSLRPMIGLLAPKIWPVLRHNPTMQRGLFFSRVMLGVHFR